MRYVLLSSLISLFAVATTSYAAREFRKVEDLPKAQRDKVESQSDSKEVPLEDLAGGVAGGMLAGLLGKGYTIAVKKKKA